MKNKIPTIAAIHAHPDDTEAWCGGTLALLSHKGYRIHIATMTAGGLGGVDTGTEETIRIRKKEASEAAHIISADYHCFEQADGYLYDTSEIRVAVTAWLRRVGADIVLTHLPWDYHPDHRATAGIVESAVMSASLPNVACEEKALNQNPLLYHTTPISLTDSVGGPIQAPHFFVDISSTIEYKMKMLTCHRSQLALIRLMHGMDDFFGEMKRYSAYLGTLAGFEYAECFWQHLGGGFRKDPLIQNTLHELIH